MSFADVMKVVGDAAEGAGKGMAAGSVVPGIGTVVGGLAGLASSLVPHIFGDDATPVLAAAAKAITGADDEATQVQILSTDSAALAAYKVQALKIAGDREQAQLDAQSNDIAARLGDVADARQQTVDLAKASSSIAWGAPVISVIVLIAFFGLCTLLILRAVPDGSTTLLNILLGSLGVMASNVVNYWTGSSAGSARKTDLLANSIPANAVAKPLASEPK